MTVFGAADIYVKAMNAVKQRMSAQLETARSVIEPTPLSRRVAAALVVAYALIATIPLVWIFMTGFKTPSDAIAYRPKVIFEPSLEG